MYQTKYEIEAKLREKGFLLRDVKCTKLLFTIPALTPVTISKSLPTSSLVDFRYQKSLMSAWIPNRDIALDTMDMLSTNIVSRGVVK